MSPEAIVTPDTVDARSDIYALGAVAYYLLAGAKLFNGRSVVEVCSQHLHEKPKSLSAHGIDVPAELEAIILQCLAKDPTERSQSAAELREQLSQCAIEPWTSRQAEAWWQEHPNRPTTSLEPDPAVARTLAIAMPINSGI